MRNNPLKTDDLGTGLPQFSGKGSESINKTYKEKRHIIRMLLLGLYAVIHIMVCLWAGITYQEKIRPPYPAPALEAIPESMASPSVFFEHSTPKEPTVILASTQSETTTKESSFTFTPARSETPYYPPTATPVITNVPLSTYFLPPTQEPISADNVSRIIPIARIGKGELIEVFWTLDGRIIFLTRVGILFLEAKSLQELFFIDTEADIRSGAISHDGRVLVTGLSDGRLQLWRVSDGGLITTIADGPQGIFSVVFSMDDSMIASESINTSTNVTTYVTRIALWRISDWKSVIRIEGIHEGLAAIIFSGDGSRILAATEDGKLMIWRIIDGTLIQTSNQLWKNSWNVIFSPDGTMVASRSDNHRRISIFTTSDGILLTTLKWHHDPVCDMVFSLDGSILLSGAEDGRARLWHVHDGKLLRTMESYHSVDHVAISDDGTQLASWEDAGLVKFWRTTDGALQKTMDFHINSPYFTFFTPDNSILYTRGGYNGSLLNIWKVSDGSYLGNLDVYMHEAGSVALSPDGKLMAFSTGRIVVKRLPEWTEVWENRIPAEDYESVAFSPDGSMLACGATDNSIRLFRTSDWTPIQTFEGHQGAVKRVAFSPDGKLLASGARDKMVKLWRVSDGVNIRTLAGHIEEITNVIFSPDGKSLASTGVLEETVKLWRISDGKLLKSLPSESGHFTDIAFSIDGSIIVLISREKIVDIWRVSDWIKLRSLTDQSRVGGIAISPDGSLLATLFWDGSLLLWGVR